MNVTHIAWLGHNNYGDDIMAEAVRGYLSKKYTDITYKVWCDKRPKKAKNIKWLYPFNFKNSFYRNYYEKKALKNTDMLLIGGGSILHSHQSIEWKKNAVNYLKKTKPEAKAIGINLSVGPFDNNDVMNECLHFLKTLDGCSFRDQYSFDLATKIALPYKPILSFDLAASYLETNSISPRDKVKEIKTVGLTIRNAHRTDPDKLFIKYTDLINKIGASYPKIKLFCFSNDTDGEELTLCKNLVKSSKIKNVEIILYDCDTKSFTEELKSVDFMISTKLHGAIMSFLLRIPFTTLSYQRKIDDFINYIKLPAKYSFQQSNFDPDEIIKCIEPYQLPNTEPFFKLSKKNFEVFNM